MKPNVGDIYCVYVERLKQYTACQVTMLEESKSSKRSLLAAILELDWTGDKLPDETELRKMKPLVCDYYFWNDRPDHYFADANVPPNYILAGNLSPLVTEKTNSYSGWHVGGSIYRQKRWNQIPVERRIRFKEAAKNTASIEFAGGSMRLSTNRVHDDILRSLEDLLELEKLPCLTEIHADGHYESLVPFIISNPIVYQLHLVNHGCTSLDLRGSNLDKLILDAKGLEELYLNEGLDDLSLIGALSPNLTIHAHEKGRWITANCSAAVPADCGLDLLGSLHISNITELDLQPIVHSFPGLRELRLWGKPGTVSNLHTVEQLPKLQSFSMYDLFGFTGDQFPGPDKMPNLSWLWLTSLPTDAAQAIKAAYKKEVFKGLDLSITKPRKADWLAENLTNPFRDWDGREHITVANAKKAVQLYKKILAGIHAWERPLKDGALEGNLALELWVTEYTEAFNKMDRRSPFIETVEREEIYMVFVELLELAEQKLAGTGASNVDKNKLIDTFDALRDF